MFAAVVEDVEVFPDGALVAVDLEALPDGARFDENEEAGFLEWAIFDGSQCFESRPKHLAFRKFVPVLC